MVINFNPNKLNIQKDIKSARKIIPGDDSLSQVSDKTVIQSGVGDKTFDPKVLSNFIVDMMKLPPEKIPPFIVDGDSEVEKDFHSKKPDLSDLSSFDVCSMADAAGETGKKSSPYPGNSHGPIAILGSENGLLGNNIEHELPPVDTGGLKPGDKIELIGDFVIWDGKESSIIEHELPPVDTGSLKPGDKIDLFGDFVIWDGK